MQTQDYLAQELQQSLASALIDNKINSLPDLQPQIIYNDYNSGSNLLVELLQELQTCKRFYFAIAFITQSGLICLKEYLKLLQEKNITGDILTTDYLYFNQPKALQELQQYPNLNIRIYIKENFHIKGYIFEQNDYYTLIVGSNNLTQTALKSNKEWSLKINSLANGALINNTLSQFQQMWQEAMPLTDIWLKQYADKYHSLQKLKRQFATAQENISTNDITPNKMQQEALKALAKLQQDNKQKALLISATGTGKTYLSAFAVKKANPKRLLFLAHREQILKQACKTFAKIIPDIQYGILSANHKDFHKPYLFSTINMLSKEENLTQFAPTHFDYIIIDETHRAGASSYLKILNYFQPQFLLGMTATPERTDGFDIYQLFDHNIAYEIRLNQAMQENLLCPFHYFGITDITVDNQEINDNSTFNDLTTDARVTHIINQSQYYGFSGERLRGLIFCSQIEEAQILSQKFNERGFNTISLSGKDSQETRTNAIHKLEQKERSTGLDYIFTVDIMNEGIDIPAINQIIMLRPTKSSIIFVQQLGRGLRKYPQKDYVVILDFIGNYQNNFMIPIALSGDTSYNKDNIRHYVAEGNRFIFGASTIHFDKIARQKIYQAIDSAKLSDTALLKNEYLQLKQKLGKIPSIFDFSQFSSIDILKFLDKFKTYHNFLQKYDKDYTIRFNTIQEEILYFISYRFAKGKRIHELLALKLLLKNTSHLLMDIKQILTTKYHQELTEQIKVSLIRNLTNLFTISNEQAKFSNCIFIKKSDNDYIINDIFKSVLQDEKFYFQINEILDFALERYQKYYQNKYKNTNLVLYQKYTYEEVCYLLNWPQKINPNAMAGYFYEKTTHTMPVFINYIAPDKKRVDYTNEFLSNTLITAYSKSNRKLDSSDAKHIYNANEEQNKLYLFVRKPSEDKEAKEFYFLGEITAQGNPEFAPKYNGFKILYKLDTPVRADIFDYLTTITV
ncbi:DEAD/DEAH box helicase [Megamonas funiformis]|uniref:DEAD/DEAH box helicase n=1 Tax=Megamonas funiformis TaxID=437897 RepID=UPI001CD50021|nr:DEAD/DEAH box helicase [Megamonas funiformis]UBS48861.1 DEAD/DEAH box helicase [Megamonas funiformis]GLU99381.1 helicase [Megamonas funiformis]